MKNTESLKKETDKLSHYADHVDRENESDRAFDNSNVKLLLRCQHILLNYIISL